MLHNPDLGAFLDRLGSDPTATFYDGDLARHLVDQLGAGGGLLTLEDLAAYRVIEREPLRVRYRERTLLTNPPPTFGGALLGVALRRLDRHGDLPPAESPELAALLAATMAGVDADRLAGHPEVIAALAGDLGDDPTARPQVNRGTTHVTVADAEGNVAAMTTSNGECSGDVIDGTGIACNNMLGEDDLHPDGFHAAPPGQRVASMMSPTFVLGPDGRHVDLALGSGGSKRIRSALLQVLVATIDHRTPLAEAIDAPRIHWDEDHLEVEPGLSLPRCSPRCPSSVRSTSGPSAACTSAASTPWSPAAPAPATPDRGGTVRGRRHRWPNRRWPLSPRPGGVTGGGGPQLAGEGVRAGAQQGIDLAVEERPDVGLDAVDHLDPTPAHPDRGPGEAGADRHRHLDREPGHQRAPPGAAQPGGQGLGEQLGEQVGVGIDLHRAVAGGARRPTAPSTRAHRQRREREREAGHHGGEVAEGGRRGRGRAPVTRSAERRGPVQGGRRHHAVDHRARPRPGRRRA